MSSAIDALRAAVAAQHLPAGPWHLWLGIHGDPKVCQDLTRPSFTHIAEASHGPADYGKATAEFIAAANPATIRELLERLDRAEAAVRGAIDDIDLRLADPDDADSPESAAWNKGISDALLILRTHAQHSTGVDA